MKAVLITILIGLFTWQATAQEITFQGFAFGSTSEKFIEKLGTPTHTWTPSEKKMFGNLTLAYDGIEVAGYAAKMEADFQDNKLLGGAYTFSFAQKSLIGGAVDPTFYVTAYLDLEKKLTKKYGKPNATKLPDAIDEDGVSALIAQNIADSAPYQTGWGNPAHGGLILSLSCKNGTWNLLLGYFSPEELKKMQATQTAKDSATDGL